MRRPVPAFDPELPVAVLGSGNRGRALRRELERTGSLVVAFLDNSVGSEGESQIVDGLPVFHPERWAESVDPSGWTIALGIFNHRFDLGTGWVPLAQRFGSALGLYGQADLFEARVGENYWLDRSSAWRDHPDAESLAAKARTLFADDESLRIFDAHAAARREGDERLLPPMGRLCEQYAPPGIPLPDPLVVADGGACDGEALRNLLAAGKSVAGGVLFEPDPENAKALERFAREAAPGCSVRAEALSDRPGTVRFLSGAGSSSRVESAEERSASDGALPPSRSTGATEIPSTTLDLACARLDPPANFVKLDVEGSELAALRGAANLIRDHRPALAVCAYHRPFDLFEIPLELSRMEGARGRRFWLRQHGGTGFDLVLYVADPKS